MKYLTLTPAYNRDYKSKKEVIAAWEEGKDFKINDISCPNNGGYANKDSNLSGYTLNVRYKKLTQICVIVVK